MDIGVVGAGYVGLVTAACLAELGHNVVCVDVDATRVAAIKRGDLPIHEEGLDDLVKRNLGTRLEVTTIIESACRAAEVAIVAVGTPLVNGLMDDSYLRVAVDAVARSWRGRRDYPVLVMKSTVLPSTTDRVVKTVAEQAFDGKPGVDFGVAVNPEFLTEGQAVADFMKPDRIVIGADDSRSALALRRLYAVLPEAPIVETGLRNAEMIKYASNALLATLISFSNEIANIGSAIGNIDVAEVMRGVHNSRYLSVHNEAESVSLAPITAFLMAGAGYGGSCLPKDVQALAAASRAAGELPRLLDAVTAVNQDQPARLLRILTDELGNLEGTRVAILGLAFKPDTRDVRESPALEIAGRLLRLGASVIAHDPVVQANQLAGLVEAGLEITDDLETAVAGSEAIVLVTRWDQYQQLWKFLADREPQPLVVDGRRSLDGTRFERFRAIGL